MDTQKQGTEVEAVETEEEEAEVEAVDTEEEEAEEEIMVFLVHSRCISNN